MRIQNEEPPSLTDVGIDAEIDAAVQRALRRRPEDRWETVDAFADALEDASPQANSVGGPADAPDAPVDPQTDAPEQASSDTTHAPGPASTLVTAILVALVATNVAWFVWYLTPEPSSPVPSAVQVRSDPSGATVYRKGNTEPLGTTPLELKPTGDTAVPLHLRLSKSGFADTQITYEIADSPRLSVELTPADEPSSR
jgi:hypothetical protein